MRDYLAGSAVIGAAGSIVNTATVTGTGVDWTSTFEPYATMTVPMGVITAAGSVVMDLQASTVLGSGYASIGSLAVAGAAAGTQAYSVSGELGANRYVRSVLSVAAGSATMGATLYGKKRTV